MTVNQKSWNDGASPSNTQRNDNAALHRLGKRPQLKRNFGFMSMVGFSTTLMVSFFTELPSMVLTMDRQHGNLWQHYYREAY